MRRRRRGWALRRVVDLTARVLGWTFLAATLFLLLRPGGILRARIDAALQERERTRVAIAEWSSLVRGAPTLDAGGLEPSVVEFIDYLCHYCGVFESTLDSIRDADGVALPRAVRHNPNPHNPRAMEAARAAVCAQMSGEFEVMHRFLATANGWAPEDWLVEARAHGVVGADAIAECVSSSRADSALAADAEMAASLRLRATPAFAIAGQGVVVGLLSPDQVKEMAISAGRRGR